MGGGGDEIFGKARFMPSPNDMAAAWTETLNNEDRVSIKHWKAHGATGLSQAPAMPKPPPTREELMAFARNANDWKDVVKKDPEAAEAMRKVRSRVEALLAQGKAAVEMAQIMPDSGTRAVNRQLARPDAFVTSKLNPLEATQLTKGYDPRVREWTGRRWEWEHRPKETTSFWCASWGACASDVAVDQDFQHVQPPRGDPKMAYTGHSRGWR